MADTTNEITNEELLKQLKESPLSAEQKNELETLIPDMTDEEKKELLGLIEQANEDIAPAKEEYQKNLADLNEKNQTEIEKLNREQNEEALKTMEGIDKKTSTEALKEMESEIQAVKGEVNNKKKDLTHKKPKTHLLRNFLLLIFILIAIAGGAVYAITNLL